MGDLFKSDGSSARKQDPKILKLCCMGQEVYQ